MAKIIYVLVAMIALNVALAIFTCSDWNIETGECAGSLTGIGENVNSTLWNMVYNPTNTAGDFWNSLFGGGWGLSALVGVIGVGTVLVGSLVMGRDVTPAIYAAIAIGALATTIYPSIKLWSLINGLGMVGDTFSRRMIAIILIGGMIVTVMFTVLDWARAKE